MYQHPDEGGPQVDGRLTLRIAIFGVAALVLFGVLFFRLWFLQILNGEEYLAEAQNNRTRELRVGPPRGAILDRDGKVLVDNRTSMALLVDPEKLPEDLTKRRAELSQLAELTHTSLRRVRTLMHEEAEACARRAGDVASRRRQLSRLLPPGEPRALSRG